MTKDNDNGGAGMPVLDAVASELAAAPPVVPAKPPEGEDPLTGTVEVIRTGDVTQDVIVRPPTAVMKLLGEHDPAASAKDMLQHVLDENARLTQSRDDFRQTAWTLGQALTTLALQALSGTLKRTANGDILLTAQEIRESHDSTITVAPTADNDIHLRVRSKAVVPVPQNEAV